MRGAAEASPASACGWWRAGRPRPRRSTLSRVQRPGLALTGYTDYIRYGRVQIIGRQRDRLPAQALGRAARRRPGPAGRCRISCFVVTKGLDAARRSCWREAEARGIPRPRRRRSSRRRSSSSSPRSSRSAWPCACTCTRCCIGRLRPGRADRGESGIGKSECALDLIDRGHRLVADDVVEIKRIGRRPRGRLARPHALPHGAARPRASSTSRTSTASPRSARRKRVELVVSLERWEAGRGVRPARPARREVPDPRRGAAAHPHAGGARPQHRASWWRWRARNQLSKERGYDAARAASSERVDEMIEARRLAAPVHGGAAAAAAPSRRARGAPRRRSHAALGAAAPGRPSRDRQRPQLLVITGLAARARRTSPRALEDSGWFCVDNLPTALIPRFADLIRGSAGAAAARRSSWTCASRTS